MATAISDSTELLYTRQPLSKTESSLLSHMAEKGKNIFTLSDVTQEFDIPYINAKLIISRLMRKGWLTPLSRGTYLIVPLEAGVMGKYSEHEFVVASHLIEPYYIGYWSAMQYHGLTEQVPITVFVATTRHVTNRSRSILDSRYRFVTVAEKKFFGFSRVLIANSAVNISDKAKTIVDSLDHPEYCGGVSEAAKALWGAKDDVHMEDIVDYGIRMGNSAVLKRLGYLVELLGMETPPSVLDRICVNIRKGYTLLDPLEKREGRHTARWNLIINVPEDSVTEWRQGY
jgi:predicted transcriptional regulator of viral defense system